VGGNGFQQYADTRSQVYRGYLSESPSTGAAVASTRGQVVTYNGVPAVTYFFSTSGGYTEDIENVFTGDTAKPWLRGVKDPYDDASPYHRWGPYEYSTQALDSKLGNWVKGKFTGLEILARGVSPRVVRAAVQGTGGSVNVTGPQLRARLGLRDTWLYLRRVSSTADPGAQARTASGTRPLVAIHGTVSGTRGKFVTLQRRVGNRWVKVVDVPVERKGSSSSYQIHVGEAGYYRVRAGWAAGPTLKVVP
jgi:stage II sporulation protein D